MVTDFIVVDSRKTLKNMLDIDKKAENGRKVQAKYVESSVTNVDFLERKRIRNKVCGSKL